MATDNGLDLDLCIEKSGSETCSMSAILYNQAIRDQDDGRLLVQTMLIQKLHATLTSAGVNTNNNNNIVVADTLHRQSFRIHTRHFLVSKYGKY